MSPFIKVFVLIMCRVKSDNFGYQGNSDIHLQIKLFLNQPSHQDFHSLLSYFFLFQLVIKI